MSCDKPTPPAGAPKGTYFDEAAANAVCNFFERYLILPQTGERFILQPWQRAMLRHVYGWKNPDGSRLVRTLYLEIGKKAGKGAIASGLSLYMLCADGERAGLVVSAAVDTTQASQIHNNAKIMAEKSPAVTAAVKPYRHDLRHKKSNSAFKVLSSAPETKEGLDISCCIFDELAKHKSDALWRVLRGSTLARRQPLTIVMTNAGYDRTSVGWQVHEYADRVRTGKHIDPTFHPIIYAAPDDAPLETDEQIIAAGRMANPSLGVTIKETDFVALAREAMAQGPAALNDWKRKCLGHWNQQASAFVPMDAWRDCGELRFDLAALKGRTSYPVLDLSQTTDLTALSLVFPNEDGSRHVLCWHWMPGAKVIEAEQRDRQPYRAWTDQGYAGSDHKFLELTDGSAIDYGLIMRRIEEIHALYPFADREIGFDSAWSWQFGQMLEAHGFTPVATSQKREGMNAPMRELYKLVTDRRLHHGANPLLDWQASILEANEYEGLVKPVKGSGAARKRIDGMVTLIQAIDRAGIGEAAKPAEPSVYESRGLFVL